MPLTNAEIAERLAELGRRTALSGGNPYSARAYKTAAENVAALDESIATIIDGNRLLKIPGVGKSLADVITQLFKTGTHPKLETLRTEIPDAVAAVAELPGIRPDQAVKIIEKTGAADFDELEALLRRDEIELGKGFTVALRDKILQGIEIKRSSAGRMHIHHAEEIITKAIKRLRSLGFEDIVASGDFRRKFETPADLSVIAINPGKLKVPEIPGVTIHSPPADSYGAMLLWTTASAAHLEGLTKLAAKKGLTLTSKGLFKGKKRIAGAREEEIYDALGLQFIPPEIREGRNEITLAGKNKLVRPLELSDLRGILHAHTDRSDGVHTLAQMADATKQRGYAYFGVADHSQSAHYAGGLSVAEIAEQHKEIVGLNKTYADSGFQIFKGIESDILADGSLDYPVSVLRRFDFIVASIHSRFKLSKKEQTARLITAVKNPYTTILGHMTGRQLLRRPGYEIDVEAVLRACADHGVVVEINANPWRLDFDWRWHQTALSLGCWISINPDAHSTTEIDLTRWGVEMAKKGMVPKERCLNALPLKEFKAFLAARRKRVFQAEKVPVTGLVTINVGRI